jgi:hypothetical protein
VRKILHDTIIHFNIVLSIARYLLQFQRQTLVNQTLEKGGEGEDRERSRVFEKADRENRIVPLTDMNASPHSFAAACARIVFPHPGGPYSSIALGMRIGDS